MKEAVLEHEDLICNGGKPNDPENTKGERKMKNEHVSGFMVWAVREAESFATLLRRGNIVPSELNSSTSRFTFGCPKLQFS